MTEHRFEIKGIFNDMFVPAGGGLRRFLGSAAPAWVVGSNGAILKVDPC